MLQAVPPQQKGNGNWVFWICSGIHQKGSGIAPECECDTAFEIYGLHADPSVADDSEVLFAHWRIRGEWC